MASSILDTSSSTSVTERTAVRECGASMATYPMITEAEAAELLSFKPDTLRQWRNKGRGPRFYRFGRDIRYAVQDLEIFISCNRVEQIPRKEAI